MGSRAESEDSRQPSYKGQKTWRNPCNILNKLKNQGLGKQGKVPGLCFTEEVQS